MSGKNEAITDVARVHVTPAPVELNKEQIQLLTDTIAKGATIPELRLFVEVCRRMNLDPFSKQIHAIKRWDSTLKREVMTFQIGIDGFRVKAQRSGLYEGQEGPYWCGPDGKWVDVWLSKVPPAAAKVGVYRKGFKQPLWAVAIYSEYVQLNKENKANSVWAKMPANQLSKCSEALALRKAFPELFSGVYASEEMEQSDNADTPQSAAPGEQDEPDGVKLMWSAMQGRSIAEVCKVFADLKARMIQVMGPGGELEYHRLLHEFGGGVQHANQLRGRNAARNASKAMWWAIAQAEALNQPVEDEPAAEPEADREPGQGE